MIRVKDIVCDVLDDMNPPIDLSFKLTVCQNDSNVFMLELASKNKRATFDILDQRIKCVSLVKNDGFDEQFISRFQSRLIDMLY